MFGAVHPAWAVGTLAALLFPALASVVGLAPAAAAPLAGLDARPKVYDESTQLGWWNGVLKWMLLPLFVAMLVMFIWFELELVFISREGAEKTHQLARLVGGGIVSPAASVICFFAAIYVAMYSGLRRLALVGRGFVGLTRLSSAFRRLAGPLLYDGEQVTSHDMRDELGPLLDMPVQHLPAPYAAVLLVSLVACVAALDPGAWSVRGWPAPPIATVDGWAFSWFLVCATATALAAALLLVAQAMAAWQKLRRGLERVARLCIAPAFGAISEHARWDLSLTPPRVKDLVPLVNLANRFLGAARRGDVFDLPDVIRSKRFDPPSEADAEAYLLQSSLAFSLWRLSDQVLQRLEEVRWTAPADGQLVLLRGRRQSDELSAEKQCHMGAVVVALQYAFVVRDILARMMSSLFAAMLCLTLLTCAHLFYVFQGRSSLLTIDLLAVAVTAIGAMWVLVGMERDAVLSRLRHSTPGQIDFSWGFVQRIAIYGVLPLVAVVGALFPEVAGPVLGWLDPLKKLITF